MPLAEVVLTAAWPSPDRTPPAGQVVLQLTGDLRDAADGLIVPARSWELNLDDNGAIAVQVYATDDPDALPTDRQYFVRERITGAPARSYYVSVPSAPAGSRLVADAVVASGAVVLTSATAAFTGADVGKYVTAPQLDDLTKIASVTNGTTVVLTRPAVAAGSGIPLIIGAQQKLASAA